MNTVTLSSGSVHFKNPGKIFGIPGIKCKAEWSNIRSIDSIFFTFTPKLLQDQLNLK